MKAIKATHFCPCGSGKRFQLCCGPYVNGDMPAPTAEALMRSRYCAYTVNDADYLLQTWHPDTRPDELDLDDEPLKWLDLTVGETTGGQRGDTTGTVAFVARYKFMGRAGKLQETSRFERIDGRWYYRDGDIAE